MALRKPKSQWQSLFEEQKNGLSVAKFFKVYFCLKRKEINNDCKEFAIYLKVSFSYYKSLISIK